VDHRPGYHGDAMGTEAVRFLVLWTAGWIHSRQLEVIDFLREENRVLREQLDRRRLRFTDDQRRRLAVKDRIVGRRRLGEFAVLVDPAHRTSCRRMACRRRWAGRRWAGRRRPLAPAQGARPGPRASRVAAWRSSPLDSQGAVERIWEGDLP
jgi:hypothetical protein